jgi:two-component system, sensor histidine kinase and response regulator
LRAITGYTDVLLQDSRPQLTSAAQHAFDAIRAAASRMGDLINDLLELAHLSRQPLSMGKVSMAALVERVVGELRHEYAARQIDFRIGALPDCAGDESLLTQVLANLLSNACKFTERRAPAIVSVDAQRSASQFIYCVRDNGAGFDMAQAGRLFGVFQRLHSGHEFPGTGIGLSIVQRIVNRHGGKVWAEAEAGKGAAFFFSLPAAEGIGD